MRSGGGVPREEARREASPRGEERRCERQSIELNALLVETHWRANLSNEEAGSRVDRLRLYVRDPVGIGERTHDLASAQCGGQSLRTARFGSWG